ncbi:MAG: response regulator transcription factor [Bacteroidales bacterium]|jgi:two-component system response regulator NreC
MMKLLIVDDHSIIRQGLVSLITQAYPDWTIFEAGNGVQAIVTALKEKPDIILMDHLMPKLDGLKAASIIRRDLPGTQILMLTMSNRDDLQPAAREAGIKCLISKDKSTAEIMEIISGLVNGISKNGIRNKIPEEENRKIVSGKRPDRHNISVVLTDRETDVAKLLMKGYDVQKISDYLAISKRTVEGHKSEIMRKFNQHSTPALMHYLNNNNPLFSR